MDKETKKLELLKLEYEHWRTWMFSTLAAILVSAFGIISNLKIMTKEVILSFSLGFICLIIIYIIVNKKFNESYYKLKNWLKERGTNE